MVKLLIFVFIVSLCSLYLLDRVFNLIRCFRKSERFTQKPYERLLTFLSIAALITAFFV